MSIKDTNNNYGSDAKFSHRARVLRKYQEKITGKQRRSAISPDAVCVTLPSCIDGKNRYKSHPSRDIQQWSAWFGDKFIGVNFDDLSLAFRKHHPNCLFMQGDAYQMFAQLAPFHKGLFYLDTTQTMDKIARDPDIIASLSRFLTTGKSSTMLALNAVYNWAYNGESPNATHSQIKAKIRAIVRNLPTKGWIVSIEDYDTYQSAAKTRMVCIFFSRKKA